MIRLDQGDGILLFTRHGSSDIRGGVNGGCSLTFRHGPTPTPRDVRPLPRRSETAAQTPPSGRDRVHDAAIIPTMEASMADEITKITSGTLIAAEKVEGTNVYNLQGEKLGTIDDIMLDKVTGKAIYAIMSFGGFLGIGEKFHPLPWSTLKYDSRQNGYVVNLDKRALESAPTYGMNEDFAWTPEYGRRVDQYYKAPSYW
jgi:hypothetical protein